MITSEDIQYFERNRYNVTLSHMNARQNEERRLEESGYQIGVAFQTMMPRYLISEDEFPRMREKHPGIPRALSLLRI